MTRWARSGSTQKHKKMPGDATKWGEFDNQKALKFSPKTQKKVKREQTSEQNSSFVSGASSSSKSEASDSFENNGKVPEEQMTCVFKVKGSNKELELENSNSYVTHINDMSSNLNQVDELKFSTKKSHSPNKSSTEQKGSQLKKKKLKQNSMADSKNFFVDDKTLETASDKVCKSKKEMHLEKLRKKREKMGILLLPAKVERKLYNIRRILKEKGFTPQMQKEILRKERRKEELKFRKTFNPSKLCFHCREPGHMFADCPKKSVSLNQETGICFKCGSSEHTSFKCPKKVQGFPFAKCFICKEQGHISKDCPRNKRGIYPKGGRCNLCGNVNHLKKDCPSLMKKKDDESSFTLHTINEDTSIGAEITEKEDVKKRHIKKPKVVKF